MDARLPVRAFFTNRYEGVSAKPFDQLNLAEHVGDDPSAVAVNRAVVAELAGGTVVFMRPQHAAKVAVLGSEYLDGRDPPEADVLVTAVPGLGLATLAADCVPLLIHDGLSGAVAAVHIGREGLRLGAVDAAIAALVDIRGGWREQWLMTASVGPAICGHCYEVSNEVRDQVARLHPIATATTSWGSPALDLPRAVVERLAQLGLTNVLRHRYCTFEDLSLFSYRREKVTGRQAGVVVCEVRQ
ncbi:MAG: laccase domain-containing protein [Demequinaceae bacterium]|nr:laccase domain-containing protein [Demequinaceae bacterium]